MGAIFRHDALICPTCGYDKLDRSMVEADGEARPPAPGDLTTCACCASILVFGEGLRLSVANETDLEWVSAEEGLAIVRRQREIHLRPETRCRNGRLGLWRGPGGKFSLLLLGMPWKVKVGDVEGEEFEATDLGPVVYCPWCGLKLEEEGS